MNLLEIMKHYNIQFPESATHTVQDKDGQIKFSASDSIEFDEFGIWLRKDIDYNDDNDYNCTDGCHSLAMDWNTAIVSKLEYNGY